MSEGTVPVPPAGAETGGDKPLEARIADLERRLAEAIEGKALQLGDRHGLMRSRPLQTKRSNG